MIFHGENNTKHDEETYDDRHQEQNNMYMRFNLNNVNNVNEITVQFSNMATTMGIVKATKGKHCSSQYLINFGE